VLTSDQPKARYLAPSNPRQAEFIARHLLQELAGLSSGQSYNFSREELVDMLDDALAGTEKEL
jgi:hypothetical protein